MCGFEILGRDPIDQNGPCGNQPHRVHRVMQKFDFRSIYRGEKNSKVMKFEGGGVDDPTRGKIGLDSKASLERLKSTGGP